MSTTVLGLILRPLIAVAFFGSAMWIARSIMRLIPDGRVGQLQPAGRTGAIPAPTQIENRGSAFSSGLSPRSSCGYRC